MPVTQEMPNKHWTLLSLLLYVLLLLYTSFFSSKIFEMIYEKVSDIQMRKLHVFRVVYKAKENISTW